jgi:murein L,D-transpeptidase YcbB/YkuD
MKCSALLCVTLLGLPGWACSHPRTASDATQASAGEQTQGETAADDKSEASQDSNAQQDEAQPKTKRNPSSTKPRGEDAPAASDAQQPEVATSARGLFKPGAEEKVRDKLGLSKDASLRAPLQRFQREHGLPATGMLDHETAKRLGLNPDDIFESSQD